MRFDLSILAALSTLGSVATAANMYSYFTPGCGGCGVFFENLGPQTCALTYQFTSNITEAILKNYTTIQSAKLQVWSPKNKVMQYWTPGPGLDDNGLALQCGSILEERNVTWYETCISRPGSAASWYKPDKLAQRSTGGDVTRCKTSKGIAGWFTQSKQFYTVNGMPDHQKDAMHAMMLAGQTPGKEFDSFKTGPPPVKG